MSNIPVIKAPGRTQLGLAYAYDEIGIFHQTTEAANKFELIAPVGMANYADTRLYYLALELLFKGTPSKDSIAIKKEFEIMGAFASGSLSNNHSTINIFALNNHFERAVEFMMDCVQNANYPEEEIEAWRGQALHNLETSLSRVSYVAKRNLFDNLYKHSFLGSYRTEEWIKGVSREDLLNTHKNLSNQTWSWAAISEKKPIVDWEFGPFQQIETPLPSIDEDTMLYEQWDHAEQTALKVAAILPGYSSSDYYNISILNVLLGGFFGSKLMKRIREELGLTYGIHSTLTPFSNYSLLTITGEVKKGHHEEVVDEINKVIEQLASEPISASELEVLQNYIQGKVLKQVDGTFHQMEMIQNYLWSGRKIENFSDFQTTLSNVTPLILKDVCNKYLLKTPKMFSIVG